MRFAAFKLCVVALLAACSLPSFASAEDLGTVDAPRGAQVPAKLDQQIDQAVRSGSNASSSELDARVRDLDATRTAIDEQKKPTVSLSVSGWVDQQVQYNVK
ncbi:hypothetical protein [Hyphomicrobium sp.]|jgi:Skp family chaperone for outer membrane proteins|uniref:hypothetical protein n=1 Tax=Hyphomicrobium sp. TaxID=82 RepID=UPI0035633B23